MLSMGDKELPMVWCSPQYLRDVMAAKTSSGRQFLLAWQEPLTKRCVKCGRAPGTTET